MEWNKNIFIIAQQKLEKTWDNLIGNRQVLYDLQNSIEEHKRRLK